MKKIILSAAILWCSFRVKWPNRICWINNKCNYQTWLCNSGTSCSMQLTLTLAIEWTKLKLYAKAMLTGRLVNGKVEIPVVVSIVQHCWWKHFNCTDSVSNRFLNDDFNGANSEYNSVPALFDGDKSNVGISFVLETVNRKSTKKRSWGTRDVMKNGKRGGIDTFSRH
jgi:hypothetical protein